MICGAFFVRFRHVNIVLGPFRLSVIVNNMLYIFITSRFSLAPLLVEKILF